MNAERFNAGRNANKNTASHGGVIVKASARIVVLATMGVAMAGLGGPTAFAQFTPANTGFWGTEIPAKDIDPAVRAAADALGLVRDSRLVIGQVNLLEYVGSGTMLDPEAATPGRPVEVSKFSYATALQIPASRLDFEAADGGRCVWSRRTAPGTRKSRASTPRRPTTLPTAPRRSG